MSTSIFNTIVASVAAVVTLVLTEGNVAAAAAVFALVSVALNVFNPGHPSANLDDIRSTKSAYGEFIQIGYNSVRFGSHLAWAGTVRAKKRGHGGYEYGQDLFYEICETTVNGEFVPPLVQRIWMNKQLVYDTRPGAQLSNIVALIAGSSGVQVFSFYYGGPEQVPPPLLVSVEGANNVPGYRGVFCILAANVPLHLYGDGIPNLEVELIAGSAGPGATREVEINLNGRDGYNSKDKLLYFIDSVSGNQVEIDSITGNIVRNIARPTALDSGSIVFGTNMVVYGWNTTYAYASDITTTGFAPGNVNFWRINQSDFTFKDVVTYVLPHDYGASGANAPNMAVSQTGRYVATLVPDYSGVVDESLIIHDYTANTTTLTAHITAGAIGITFDAADNIWLIRSGNTPGWTFYRYDVTGTLLNTYTFTPANPSSFDTGPDHMKYMQTTGDILLMGPPMFDTEFAAGKTNMYRWNTTTHTVVSEFARQSPYDQTPPYDNDESVYPLGGIYVNNSWIDETKLVFEGFNTALGYGQMNVIDLLTGVNTLYPLTKWKNFIPGIDTESGLWGGVFNAGSNSFVMWADTPNFFSSYVILDNASGTLTLQDICNDQSYRTGWLDTSVDCDYSALASIAPIGMPITARASARANIEGAQLAFLFDIIESGHKLKAVLRSGHTPVFTIDENDVVVDQENRTYQFKQSNDMELPRWIDVSFYNIKRDYEVSIESARIGSTTNNDRNAQKINLPMVMTTDQGATTAIQIIEAGWAEKVQVKHQWPIKYIMYEPTDVGILTKGALQFEVKLTSQGFGANWALAEEATSHDSGAYDSTAIGSSNSGFKSQGTQLQVVSPPQTIVLDTAMLRDSDDTVGLYATAFPTIPTSDGGLWYGADIERSLDNVTFTLKGAVDNVPVAGVVPIALGNCVNWATWDRDNFLEVAITSGVDTLIATSTDEVLLWQQEVNLAYYGGELLQFAAKEELQPGTWRLYNLLRGRRGTESFIGTHGPNEPFVMIDPNILVDVTYGVTDIGVNRYYRAKNDSPNSFSDVVTSDQTTRRLMPYAPWYFRGIRDGSNNLTISFLRRSRMRGKTLWDSPLFETAAIFEADIYNGVTIVRTITQTASGGGSVIDPTLMTVYYSAADQTTDFGSVQNPVVAKVYQLNAIVGRGYPGSASV